MQVTGEVITLAGTIVDVSGYRGGGTALIGGDVSGGNVNAAVAANPKAALAARPVPTATTVTVDAATVIDASANEQRSRRQGGRLVGRRDCIPGYDCRERRRKKRRRWVCRNFRA